MMCPGNTAESVLTLEVPSGVSIYTVINPCLCCTLPKRLSLSGVLCVHSWTGKKHFK